MHGLQLDAPSTAWKVPAVHLLQADWRSSSANVPELQLVGVIAPSAHAVPAGQASHAFAPTADE